VIKAVIKSATVLLTFCIALGMARADENYTSFRSLKKHFSLTNRLVYDFRSVGGDSDSDIYAYWNLRGRDLLSGKMEFYFSGRLHRDVDGTSSSLSDDLLVSVEDVDSYKKDQIYQLYIKLRDPKNRYMLKLGRQYVEDAGWLHMDGGLLKLYEKEKINGSIFLGKPVSYYSSSSDDWTTGYSLIMRPWNANKIRLTYVYYKDDYADQNDELYTFDMWQRFGEQIRAHGRLSFLDYDFENAGIDCFYVSPERFFDVLLTLNRWGSLNSGTRQYAPLSSVLGKRESYTVVTARSNFFLKPWLSISPGMSIRLVDESKKDDRNRQFTYYDITFNTVLNKQWTASVTGNYWDVSEGDSFFGITGEVDYHPSKRWSVAAGTAYLDYDYDSALADNSSELSPDVYTLYADIKYIINKSLSLRVKFELEDNSVESSDSVRIRTSLTARL
jgi:hypothetical protein